MYLPRNICVTMNEDVLDKEIMGEAVCLRQSSFRECSLICLGCVHKMPHLSKCRNECKSDLDPNLCLLPLLAAAAAAAK